MKKTLLLLLFVFCNSYLFSQTYYMNVNLKDGTTITYKIADIKKLDFSGITDLKEIQKMQQVIKSFKVLQNYPNPFNPHTTIEYEIPKTGQVEVSIIDMNGRLVKSLMNNKQQAGLHSVIWNGQNVSGVKVASGFYIYMVNYNGSIISKKMILIK